MNLITYVTVFVFLCVMIALSEYLFLVVSLNLPTEGEGILIFYVS